MPITFGKSFFSTDGTPFKTVELVQRYELTKLLDAVPIDSVVEALCQNSETVVDILMFKSKGRPRGSKNKAGTKPRKTKPETLPMPGV